MPLTLLSCGRSWDCRPLPHNVCHVPHSACEVAESRCILTHLQRLPTSTGLSGTARSRKRSNLLCRSGWRWRSSLRECRAHRMWGQCRERLQLGTCCALQTCSPSRTSPQQGQAPAAHSPLSGRAAPWGTCLLTQSPLSSCRCLCSNLPATAQIYAFDCTLYGSLHGTIALPPHKRLRHAPFRDIGSVEGCHLHVEVKGVCRLS